MARVSRVSDPRFIGFAANGLAGGYLVALFLPASTLVRVVVAAVAVVICLTILYFALPPWRGTERQKAQAGWIMVGEAVLAAAVGTIIKLVTR